MTSDFFEEEADRWHREAFDMIKQEALSSSFFARKAKEY